MKSIYSPKHLYATSINKKFSCQMCGECCIGWDINVDKETFENLSQYFKDHSLPYTKEDPFIIYEDNSGNRRVKNRLINGRCIFLEDNNLCYIHRVLGAKAKSKVCNSFPNILYTATPRGVFNTLSFSCRAAANLLDYKGELNYELSNIDLKGEPAKNIIYHKEKRIPWSIYFLIEEYLMDLLQCKDFKFEDSIIMGSFFLWEIYNNFIEKNKRDYKEIKENLNNLKSNHYEKIFSLSRIGYSSLHIQLKFIYVLFQKRMQGAKSVSFFLDENYIETCKKIYNEFNLKEDIEKFNSRFAIKYYRAYHNSYKAHLDKIEHIFRNFFLHRIFGKNLFVDYGLIIGYHIILTLYALMRCYCMCLWAEDFHFEDIFKSISFVERYFIHTPKILEFWKSMERVEIMSKPIFAHILIHI